MLFIVAVSLGCAPRAYCQNYIDLMDILNIREDIIKLESRIDSHIEMQRPDLIEVKGLQMFHEVFVNLEIEEVQQLDSESIFSCLRPMYSPILSDGMKYILTDTRVTDSEGNTLAWASEFGISYPSDQKPNIAQEFSSNKIDCAFRINGSHFTIVNKDGELFVMERKTQRYKRKRREVVDSWVERYSWEDFISVHLKTWLITRSKSGAGIERR